MYIADGRFPSPRYTSSEPYPSVLSESSPFPDPVPHPVRAPFDQVKPLDLDSSELHIRLIVQAIASQIDDTWNEATQTATEEVARATVPARDFMIMSVPSHELSEGEREKIGLHLKEMKEVTARWQRQGGVYVPAGKGSRWIGIDPEPKDGGPVQQLSTE